MHKPQQSEYAKYYETYVSLTENEPIIHQLNEHSESTLELLESLNDDQLDFAYAHGKWTIRELFQHIIDTEIVFAYRAFSIARGESQPLTGFDQDEYAAIAAKEKLSLEELKNTYRQTRRFTVSLFGYLKDADLKRIGTASGSPLSARAAGYIIIGHELHHLKVLMEKYINV